MSRPRRAPAEKEKDAFSKAATEFRRHAKNRIEDAGMQQYEAADIMGLSPPSVSRLLSNPGDLSVSRLRKMNKAFGLDIKVVLTLLGYAPAEIKKFKGGSDADD